MLTPEQFIMQHAQVPYDPVKAHDYYIRTRKLKGRKAGLLRPTTAKPLTGDLAGEKTNTVAKNPGTFQPKGTPKAELITTKRQQEVQARVKVLKGKLTILNAILKQLITSATGSAPQPAAKRTTSVAKKTSAAASRKPLTTAQKRDAAKKQKVRYQKTHPNAGKKDQATQQKIKEVKMKIEQVKSELKAAITSARDNATRKPPAAMGRRNS